MTVEVPPTTTTAEQENETTTKQSKDVVNNTTLKKTLEAAATDAAGVDEPTLNIQIEQLNETKTGEELMPTTSATEEKPKRKGLFNNPFVNKGSSGSAKKDASDEVAATGGENKITKGIGNFLSKVKQTASSTNIKELSESASPMTTTVEVKGEAAEAEEEEEQAPATSAITEDVPEYLPETQEVESIPSAAASEQTTNKDKRQSFLNKLFGGNATSIGAIKKKEVVGETENKGQRKEEQTEGQEEQVNAPTFSSSTGPPLSRRVTGFFANKLPKLDKKQQKSPDKVETVNDGKEEVAAAATYTDDTTKKTEEEGECAPTKKLEDEASSAVKVTDTITSAVQEQVTTN